MLAIPAAFGVPTLRDVSLLTTGQRYEILLIAKNFPTVIC